MIGNEEDFTASLGFAVEGVDEHLSTFSTALEYGAPAMTTSGDTTLVTTAEVLKLASGGGARVDR